MLTKDVLEFLKEDNGIALVSTVSEFGIVNLSPRFILESTPDELYFVSLLPNKTLYNLKKNQNISILKYSNSVRNGRLLVIKGTIENIKSGPIFEKFTKLSIQAGFPIPLAVTKVKPEFYKFL